MRERDGSDKESSQDIDNDDSDEDEYGSDSNDENHNDSMNPGGEEDSNDNILAFIDDEEEVQRPVTTHKGRSITRKLEIDFYFDSLYFMFEKQ